MSLSPRQRQIYRVVSENNQDRRAASLEDLPADPDTGEEHVPEEPPPEEP